MQARVLNLDHATPADTAGGVEHVAGKSAIAPLSALATPRSPKHRPKLVRTYVRDAAMSAHPPLREQDHKL